MGRGQPARRLAGRFTLGGEQAEADPLLRDAFFVSDDYLAVEVATDPRCFLVGRTGSGKSALLEQLEIEHPGHVIRVNPEALSLTYITDLGVLRYLDSLDVNLDPLFIALWKHVFLVEVIRHHYKVDSPAAKQNFLTSLGERIKRDPTKKAALDYLNQFESRFWCESDERIKEITQSFERDVEAEAQARFGFAHLGEATLHGAVHSKMTAEERIEQTERFQRVVNETQLPRLHKMVDVLDEDILDSPQYFTYILVDDLDRDWVDERLVNSLIRCLFRTVLDLKRVRQLKVLVALRTNIFEELDFGKRSGGQEEKFRALALRMRWRRIELTKMLDERTRVAAEHADLTDVNSVRDLLPPTTKSQGRALDYILDRTLMRPRDAIAFLNEALGVAAGKPRIDWSDLREATLPYSRGRLLALRDEWKLTYPDIHKLVLLFKGVKSPLTKDGFTKLLDEGMLLGTDQDFGGSRWLTDLAEPMWQPHSEDVSWAELYGPLTELLYRIGLIGCASSAGAAPTYAYDNAEFAEQSAKLTRTSHFAVHPMFHSALEIGT
ncbi:MAG: P-loop ATPase, Sll1717 family [Actinomycetota bacterium]